MLTPRSWQRISAILLFTLAIGFSLYFYFFSTPDELVSVIGIENAYVLMFTFAMLGGLTTLNTVPYYSLMLVLASAGINPLLLGLSSALGVMTGDSFSYYIGFQGATIIPRKLHALFTRIHVVAVRYPRTFPFVCFAYGAMSPFSNDLITMPAGMAKIPYRRVMLPLALGNVVFNVALAYLSLYAYNFVHAVFVG